MKKLKVLFNCSTNTVGGGAKNSAIFIKYAMMINVDIYWKFAVSPEVYDLLSAWNVDLSRTEIIFKSPSKSMYSRALLVTIAKEYDLVFTLAGPAYVQFTITHVMGVSDGFITHGDFVGYHHGRKWRHFIATVLAVMYKVFFVKKCEYWLFQTNTARDGFVKRFRIEPGKTYVVSNAVDSDLGGNDVRLPCSRNQNINILVPGGPYPHKGYTTIPALAKELNLLCSNDYKIKFILTIDSCCSLWKEMEVLKERDGLGDSISTIGSYSYSQLPKVMTGMDFVYVPSFLETFSASYLEAFYFNKPLIVNEREFASEICGDSALYVQPLDVKKSALLIKALIDDTQMQKKLTDNGSKRLQVFPDHRVRFFNLVDIIKGLVLPDGRQEL